MNNIVYLGLSILDLSESIMYEFWYDEAKYQLLINRRESTGLKYLNDCKAFIGYLNDMDDIYKNIVEYNPYKNRKILIIFDVVIADMLRIKNSMQ